MVGSDTFWIATGPAAVTALAGYFGARRTAEVAQRGVAADIMKFKLEREHDTVQAAYVALIEADRERQYQGHRSRDPEHARKWNDAKFRPGCGRRVLARRTAGSRHHLDYLMASYWAEASNEELTLTKRDQHREDMIAAMRADLRAKLDRATFVAEPQSWWPPRRGRLTPS